MDIRGIALEIYCRDLAKKSLTSISPRELHRDLLKLCQEAPHRDIAKRPLVEIRAEILPKGLVKRPCTEILPRDVL